MKLLIIFLHINNIGLFQKVLKNNYHDTTIKANKSKRPYTHTVYHVYIAFRISIQIHIQTCLMILFLLTL